jgi:hypothetical protein
MWWTIFVRNGGKAHIDQLLLTNLNYEWQRNSERRESVLPCNCFTCDTQNCKSQLKQRPYAFKFFTVAPLLKPFDMSALPQ